MEGINVEEAIAKQLLKNAEIRQQNLLDRIISGLQRQPPLEQRELAIYRESLEAVTQECLEHHKKYVAAGEGDASEHSTYEETTKQKINEVNRTIQDSFTASKRAPPTETSDEHAKRRRMELEKKLQEVKEKALQAQREQRDIEAALKEQEVPRTSTPIRPESPRWSRAQDISGIHNMTATTTSTQWLDNFVSRMKANPFNGDPKEWLTFIAAFESFVHDTTLTNQQKLLILGDVLSLDVKKRMAHLLQTPGTYERAIEELRQKYGGVQQLVRYRIQRLILLPSCRQGDHSALYEFSLELHDTVATLQALEQADKLSYGTTLEQVSCKLPPDVRSNWARFAFQLRPKYADLNDLDQWLITYTAAEEENRRTQLLLVPAQAVTTARTRQEGRQLEPRLRGSTHRVSTLATHETQDQPCGLCRAQPGHGLPKCAEFVKMAPTQRAEAVNRLKNCFRCLGHNHFSAECKKETSCNLDGCTTRHHHLLHDASRISGRVTGSTVSHHCISNSGNVRHIILLAVLPVLVFDGSKWVKTYALLDSASDSSLILTEMARKLGLEERTNNIKLKSIHGTESDISTTTTSFTIASSDHSVAYAIKNALTIPEFHLTKRKINWPLEIPRWSHLSILPLEEIDTSLVTILLGYDILDVHLTLEVRRPSKSAPGPTAIRTSLGWTVVSRFQLNQPTFHENTTSSHCTLTRLHEDPLTALVEKFSSTESFGTTPDVRKLVSPDDHAALTSYARTVRLLDTGRYEIGLPWRIPRQTLPDNSHQILKYFFALERRLLQQPELAKRYSKAINEYAELGYARQVSSGELKNEDLGSRWYVPHHAVTHPHKPNKLRVVFNLSAKHRGISLNAVLLKGPDFYPNLVGVLLRFRSKKIAVSADIAKIFLQVRLREEDQPYISYWWRPAGDVRPPQTFQMMVQTFGGVSSTSSCLYAVRRTLEDNPEFEDLRSKILRHMFVDNYLDSFDSEDTAIQDCLRLKELLSRGGFQLNQWTSSSRRVLAPIPPEERDKPELDLDLDELPVERMLGNWYDSQTDAFTFKFKPQPKVRSMRQLLSAVASVFDPIGFITPVVLVGKLLFQRAWKSKRGWDEKLPNDILEDWNRWSSSLVYLNQLAVPRQIGIDGRGVKRQIHIFCDASEAAFGAVAYLRIDQQSRVQINLVLSKARVAPIKPLTIPKLELQAAVLGYRLSRTIVEELEITTDSIFFWSDSQTVLQWIKSSHFRFERFVANRIGEILETSNPNQWNHIPGVLNPADEVSRGINGDELINNHRFFTHS